MEKHRLEELKKMTLEELKAISRPLEVGEVIQEGDWFPWPDANGYMFANTMIGVKLSGYSKHNGGWYSECQVWRPSK
jgi:hypothetical protein